MIIIKRHFDIIVVRICRSGHTALWLRKYCHFQDFLVAPLVSWELKQDPYWKWWMSSHHRRNLYRYTPVFCWQSWENETKEFWIILIVSFWTPYNWDTRSGTCILRTKKLKENKCILTKCFLKFRPNWPGFQVEWYHFSGLLRLLPTFTFGYSTCLWCFLIWQPFSVSCSTL